MNEIWLRRTNGPQTASQYREAYGYELFITIPADWPQAPAKKDQIDRSPSVRPFLRPRVGERRTAYALAGP